MTDFELYGTVDVTISCLDCLNHLPDLEALRRCFTLVHNYLVPDGLFIFDMNTPYKFYHIYGNNSYILEDENVLCAWQNEFDEQTKKCTFFISLFAKSDITCCITNTYSIATTTAIKNAHTRFSVVNIIYTHAFHYK